MALEKKLIIKGGVGRAILDTAKLGCGFRLEPSERGWLMTIEGAGPELASSIRELVQEIHFFYYEDDRELAQHRKWWLCDPDCPRLAYDSDKDKLTIDVAERIGFTVDSSEQHGKI